MIQTCKLVFVNDLFNLSNCGWVAWDNELLKLWQCITVFLFGASFDRRVTSGYPKWSNEGVTIWRQVVMRDLCEGFQVCLLGEAAPQATVDSRKIHGWIHRVQLQHRIVASQVPRSMRLKEPVKDYPLPQREQTMKVPRQKLLRKTPPWLDWAVEFFNFSSILAGPVAAFHASQNDTQESR